VWEGNPAALGFPSQALPAHLTYSFPDDGTTWGAFGRPTGPNVLNDRIKDHFGANDLDEGREYIRQALAGYTRYSGLTYSEVEDDDTAMSNSTIHVSTRGDVRIGCITNACSCIAYDGFPSSVGIVAPDGGGSDMCLNATYWDEVGTDGNFKDPTDDYRWLRNVISHEHGHGVGNIHSIPCTETKNMEPFISVAYDMLQSDDRRAINRSYGDRFAGNHSSADAVNLGTLDSRGTPESVILRNLSLNGVVGNGNTDEDWFRFSILGTRDIDIFASPTGGTYDAGQQEGSCSGTEQTIQATAAGNLAVTLYASNAVTIIDSANDTSNGSSESISLADRPAGTYYIRVRDVGPNDSDDQVVQLYSLTVRINDGDAPPVAIAGLDKRVQAGKNCWFMGDINSYVTDSNFPFFNAIHTYQWDRDGDGVYEVADAAKTAIQYVSNGVYPVRLRVVDDFGSDTDTINVTVWGATTLVTSVVPNQAFRGQTVPVVINGTNFKNVNSLSHIFPGAGITDIGTPDPNTMGTQIAGVSFVVAANAAYGSRNVGVQNADGSATGFMTFTVVPTPCPGDANNDGVVNFADVTSVLTFFGSTYNPGIDGLGDANNDGDVSFADITEVLTFFGIPCM
jgi:PKD repeat protein